MKSADIYSIKSSRVISTTDTTTRLGRIEDDTQDIQTTLATMESTLTTMQATELAHYNAIIARFNTIDSTLASMDAKLDIIITNTTP